MSYGTVGENKVSLSHSGCTFGLDAIRPPCHDEPYIRSRYRISALKVFRENLIFSSLFAYSTAHEANKGFLGSPNTNQNLHAK